MPGIFAARHANAVHAETVGALQAFRKRHSDAQRIASGLSTQATTVDLSHYRSVLRNQAVVDECEKLLKDFKPVTYDVSGHVKAIEAFEAKAVRSLFEEV
jgi:F-type H+-transporting ATPase subunit d